jgi:hypothetical protein
MLTNLAPFIMFIAVVLMITVIIINLMKYWLKNKVLNSGVVDEPQIKAILQPGGSKAEARSILKWGLLALFGGAGLIVNEYLPFDLYTSAVPYGIQLIFISLGLFIYYLLIKQKSSDKEQD